MPQDSPITGTADRLRIIGSRGGTRRGLVRLVEVNAFAIPGTAMVVLMPIETTLKLGCAVVLVSIVLFRAVAEIRGWPAWIQTVAPVVLALLTGLATAITEVPIMNVILLLNLMRAALTGDRRNTVLILAVSLAALLIPALIHPSELAAAAGLWAIVLTIIAFPTQARSHMAQTQAGLNMRLAGVISEMLSSEDSRYSIVSAAHELGGADVAVLFEVEPEEGLWATAGFGVEVQGIVVMPDDSSAVGLSIVGRETVFAPFAESVGFETPPGMFGKGLKSIISCPIMSDRKVIGVLCVGWKTRVPRADRPGPSIVRVLAGEVASTIEHSEMLVDLADSATQDPLTGLPNRRAWSQLLETSLQESDRVGKPLSIAVMDIDHFKKFNDRFGHQAGDRLLRELAAACKGALRRDDVLFRWGGEEFTVILPNCGPEQALEVVERLRAATPGKETTSAGVATWDGTETAEQFFDRTDAALYRAKETGRNRAVSAETPPDSG